MNKLLKYFCLTVFILINIFSCTPKSNKGTTLIRIVDGDTFEVLHEGTKDKVRLIGVDTPESRLNKKAKKDAIRSNQDVQEIKRMGLEAKYFVKSVVKTGEFVKLEFDVEKRDQYGRLLAYVFLKDGRMLNDLLVREGFASTMTYPPNVKYEQKFLQSYRFARENNKGLWHQ